MKVVHIITRMIVGGAQENTLLNCIDLIDQYGDDVTLITGPSEGPEGQLLQRFNHPRLKILEAPSLTRNINPWQDYRAYRQIKSLLKQLEPDVVHTHSAKAGILGRLAAWKLKVPAVIHTVHGAPFHPFQSSLSRTLFAFCERYAARRCHRLLCVADAMTDLMVEGRVAKRHRFTTVYSGMAIDDFLNANERRDEVRQELGFADHHIVVGKIARMFKLKGHEYLVDAARQIVERNPDVHFLLVGDGNLRSEIVRQIEAGGLTGHFHFTGLVPPTDVPKYIGAMDILAHTSLREGLARALPQALLAGKPVISFDIDGAREVCITDETGILTAPQDVATLVDGICRLAADRDLREQLGTAGKTKCREMYSHQLMTDRIRAIYEEVITETQGK
tara:strand:+ start:2865 stop:4034 length:1170 start_codon:yes stop_codon:yes gene_type:complete